jgi:nicotinate-nucleotide--dimethylbenzimidazole phosphoribosyltransferase
MSLIDETIRRIVPADAACRAAAERRLDNQTKPQGSLGRLEEIVARLVAMTRRDPPVINDKRLFIFSADHGVAAEGVSAYPAAVTPQMTLNFLAGGAAVNALARHAGVRVTVVDIGVNYEFTSAPGLVVRKIARGTANMAKGPAMSRDQAVRAVETGIDLASHALADGADLLAIGEMGIGNTTAATAVLAGLTGLDPAGLTGRGTGLDDRQLARKVDVIRRALAVNRPQADDPRDVLGQVGGFELGGMAGVVLAAAAGQRPVVADGFIASAAAFIALRLAPAAADYLIWSHRSVEPGHAALLEAAGARPLLDLGLRLGEGTGACLAVSLIEAAVRCYTEMATFDSAGVSRKSP